jgi:hypothetical protein
MSVPASQIESLIDREHQFSHGPLLIRNTECDGEKTTSVVSGELGVATSWPNSNPAIAFRDGQRVIFDTPILAAKLAANPRGF